MIENGYDRAEIVEIEGNVFSITFSDLGCVDKIFKKYDLTPDGHNWGRAIEKYCGDNHIDTSSVEFDSESDLFAAYSQDSELLKTISGIIDMFYSDTKCLEVALKEIDDDLWATPEETIEDLTDSDTDLTKPIMFDFIVEFNDVTKLKEACEIASREGYKCFYSDGNDMAAVVELIPTLANVRKGSELFKTIANNIGGKLSVYGVLDSCDESYEELEHWVLYDYQHGRKKGSD